METTQRPVTGDVLLFLDTGGTCPLCYQISVVPGPPQLCVGDRDAAVACAVRFAQREHARAWYATPGTGWQPLSA